MRRRVLLAALAAAGHLAAARAASPPGSPSGSSSVPVPVPDGFAFAPEPLDAVRAAVGRRSLSLMTIGGRDIAHEAGAAAPNAPPAYPSALLARLSAALPAVSVGLNVLAIARSEIPEFEQQLARGLSRFHPDLVIWGAGGTAAARGDDLASFHAQLSSAIQAVGGAGANLILLTPQYAPMLARLMNLPPYRSAVLQEAEDANIPVLDRYELMRFWSENHVLDLDAAKPDEQMAVARTVHDWVARLLTEGILRAIT